MFCVYQMDEETQQIDEDIHQVDDEIDQIDVVYAKTMSDAEDSRSEETGDEPIENSIREIVCDLISFYSQK